MSGAGPAHRRRRGVLLAGALCVLLVGAGAAEAADLGADPAAFEIVIDAGDRIAQGGTWLEAGPVLRQGQERSAVVEACHGDLRRVRMNGQLLAQEALVLEVDGRPYCLGAQRQVEVSGLEIEVQDIGVPGWPRQEVHHQLRVRSHPSWIDRARQAWPGHLFGFGLGIIGSVLVERAVRD